MFFVQVTILRVRKTYTIVFMSQKLDWKLLQDMIIVQCAPTMGRLLSPIDERHPEESAWFTRQ